MDNRVNIILDSDDWRNPAFQLGNRVQFYAGKDWIDEFIPSYAIQEELCHLITNEGNYKIPKRYLNEAMPDFVCSGRRQAQYWSGIMTLGSSSDVTTTKKYFDLLLKNSGQSLSFIDELRAYLISSLFGDYFTKNLSNKKDLLKFMRSIGSNDNLEVFVKKINETFGKNYTTESFLKEFQSFIDKTIRFRLPSLPVPFNLSEFANKAQLAMKAIATQLTKERALWKPVSYTIKIGGQVITVIGRLAEGGQIAYEFTVMDENAQERLSIFSITRLPDQTMELLDFPEQQVREVRDFAKFSPLRELSKINEKAKSQKEGDYNDKKIALAKDIKYYEDCLKYIGTTRICVIEHGLTKQIVSAILNGLFNSKKSITPAKEILYLNNHDDVDKIKNHIEVLEEEKKAIDKRAKSNYKTYREQQRQRELFNRSGFGDLQEEF